MFPSQEDEEVIFSYTKDEYYCIAPASVWFTKQLPKHKWLSLINNIEAEKTIYLLGSKEDNDLCASIIAESKSKNLVNLSGQLTLLQSAALMKKAKRNYVNDSGPLHLASSVNAKVTAIFCSTVPDFGFGPLSDDSIIIEVKKLECRPCGLHGHNACPKGHFKCAELIEFE